MIIKTMTGKTVDTDQYPDLKAQLIETIENSDIVNFAKNIDGCFFLYATANKEGWIKFDLPTKFDADCFLQAVNEWVVRQSSGNYRLAILPNEIEK